MFYCFYLFVLFLADYLMCGPDKCLVVIVFCPPVQNFSVVLQEIVLLFIKFPTFFQLLINLMKVDLISLE